MISKFFCMAGLAAGVLAGSTLPSLAQTASDDMTGKFLVHVDALGVFKNDSAKISVGGQRVPGATISSPNDVTLSFDAAYFVTPNIAIDLYAGLPPRAVIRGAGTISGYGTLATTNYGPAVLSAEYHFNNLGAFHPYLGVGLNYTLFLNVHHEALYNVKIPDAFGAAFRLGFDYDIGPSWTANFYVMHILLGTRVSASADPAGAIPAVAKATINPTIIGAGIGYRF
jgi:outer membrane protein